MGGGRQWPADEAAVKTNSCSFEVKYLGSVEVKLRSGYSQKFNINTCYRFSSPGECRSAKKL